MAVAPWVVSDELWELAGLAGPRNLGAGRARSTSRRLAASLPGTRYAGVLTLTAPLPP